MPTLSSTPDSERGIRRTVRQAVEIPVHGAMSSAGSADLRAGGAVDSERRRTSRRVRKARAGLQATPIESERPRGVPRELLVVWAVFFVVSAEIFATYAQLPALWFGRFTRRGLAAHVPLGGTR
jgi:hypothetical protein